jgi:hypothetical protein
VTHALRPADAGHPLLRDGFGLCCGMPDEPMEKRS